MRISSFLLLIITLAIVAKNLSTKYLLIEIDEEKEKNSAGVESLIQSRRGQFCSKRGKSCHHDHQSCCDGLECRKDDDDVLATCKQIGYTNPKCLTTTRQTCVFPYLYGGKLYHSCYDGWRGNWCPTSLNSDQTYKDWDFCVIENCSEEKMIGENIQDLMIPRSNPGKEKEMEFASWVDKYQGRSDDRYYDGYNDRYYE